MSAEARVIDVNANRARESLRVLEDAARFALHDEELSRIAKELRHGLQTALAVLPAGWVECNRDRALDAGRDITGSNEAMRDGYQGVVVAAGKRLTEALRSLEECLKVTHAAAAAQVKQLRYRAYDLESAITLRMGSAQRKQWKLCVLLTESLCAIPWQDVVQRSIAGGADCIQVREKEMNARELSQRVRDVIALAREGASSVAIIVNDRVDIALACGADGVHLGTDDLSIADARAICGTSLIIGASTHSLEEAAAAVAAGADYCGVGAMHASRTKPSVAAQGTQYLRAFVKAHPTVPHVAIGGITPQNAGALAAEGARGFAVSSIVCGAATGDAVERTARALIAALGRSPAGASDSTADATALSKAQR